MIRDDANVDFHWSTTSPVSQVHADSFSARWTRMIRFAGGLTRFYASADDGVRLWLDNQLLINQWHETTGVTYSSDILLSAGLHSVKVEFYENRGDARIQVWWSEVGAYPQWKGEYWNNPSFTGGPILTRNDPQIDFTWYEDSPAPGIAPGNFAVRWTRRTNFEAASYRFHARSDDGIRLWVDGNLLIDQWTDHLPVETTRDWKLGKGEHDLRVDYYDHAGHAEAKVWWEDLTGYPEWKGEYWSNRSFTGDPVLARNDSKIDFVWGQGSPATGIGPDDFAVRWSRRLTFDPGAYRFHARSDDGIRLWVDGNLLIDSWSDHPAVEYTRDWTASRGEHDLRVDYYDHSGWAEVKVYWELLLPTAIPPVRSTPTGTPTRTSTASPVPPTATSRPPATATATRMSPPASPTATTVPPTPTWTSTVTPPLPTATAPPPTATPVPPTATPPLPTVTPVSPTPTATPRPNLLVNGGFESGPGVGWTERSSGKRELINTDRPHTGRYSASACGYDRCTEAIQQKITLPAESVLTYYWYMATEETRDPDGPPRRAQDFLKVELYSTAGELLATLAVHSDVGRRATWTREVVRLPGGAEWTALVRFTTTTDDSLPTRFFIDDVGLRAGKPMEEAPGGRSWDREE